MFPVPDFPDLPVQLRWRTETIMKGESLTGMIAGKIVPVRTHWNGTATKPCVLAMTAGKRYCPCQTVPMSGTTTYYTPIITEKRERLVVPASALVGFELTKLPPGKLVTLYRPKARCAALRIELPPADKQAAAWVTRGKHACCHDIQEYLLHLWQSRELCDFFGVQFRPAVSSPYRDGSGPQTTNI